MAIGLIMPPGEHECDLCNLLLVHCLHNSCADSLLTHKDLDCLACNDEGMPDMPSLDERIAFT